ncbi:MAG: leucine-rich repeat domain-containing protein [Treponema sp.]|nr:leucine-rich repeat domain-containing protein [Treponema sp.]
MKKLILSAILVFLSIFLFAQKNTERMIIPESHLRFTANEDYTEVTITGFKGDKQFKGKVLEIPSKIQGIPVTAIGDSAFWGWIDTAGIEGLWIPDCVKKIGYSAFFNSSFSSIRLPEGLETIKPDTFKWCKVKSINLPSSVKTLMGRAFYDSYLESFTIPKDCVIGNSFDKDKGEYLESNGHVFESSNLKTLIFPKGRVYFYDNFSDNKGTLFSNCNYLEKIVIPEELEIVLVYYGNYEKEYTLADFITGEKINASFELQKQLKSVKIRNIADIESEERLVEYNKALNSNDYETAMQIAMEYYNKYENYKNMEWCDRYLTACEKKYLDEYNMSINTDWDKAEQIVKDCIYTINYEIEKLGWIRKNDYFKGRLEELKEKWQDLLAEIKNKKMEKII